MRLVTMITKALADQNRVRMLMALDGRELCVCQIIETFALAPSTVSKHMWILRTAGLVETRKDGRWVHYRLASAHAPPEVRGALRWVASSLRDDAQIRSDSQRLKEVLKRDPETLCRAQQRRKRRTRRERVARGLLDRKAR